jgi:molybdenum cofactor biosynthesis protein MoaC
MLDVSRKNTSLREASARARLSMQPATAQLIRDGKVPKGDPLTVAKVAAVQAAKNTSQIIPYCHPLPVEFVGVEFELADEQITIEVQVKAIYRTGVEMEAMTAASVAALTIYDMLKMVDDTMEIQGVELRGKKGGKSSFTDNYDRQLRAAVLVMSDSIAEGSKDDRSGQIIRDRLMKEGLELVDYSIVSDDVAGIVAALKNYADEQQIDLVLTTGGTGFSPRDNTPEALSQVIEREIPGINEAARAYGQQRTPFAMLSRGSAGLRGQTLIVCLPGSSKGVAESLDALFPGLTHAFKMIWGFGHDAAGKGAPK